MPLRSVSLDELIIDDEESFAHVAIYARLKDRLRRSGQRFLIPAQGTAASWDRTLFLNLTYWNAASGADVLCDDHIPGDVVAHVAWHHLAGAETARNAGPGVGSGGSVAGSSGSGDSVAGSRGGGDSVAGGGAGSAEAMLFGESIASAFDLYLVGRLADNVPDSDFIATQLPIMSEAAQQAGLSEAGFAELVASVARDPERAFEDLRALLFDAATALVACRDAAAAAQVLEGFAGHRFEPLLHHYQLSNWVLYARAYAAGPARDENVRRLDATLRQAPVSLDWLAEHWLPA